MSRLTAFLRKHQRTKRVMMRPGVSFVVLPQTRADLRFFCGRWAEATAEYDRFIAVARCKSRLLDVGAKHCVYSLTFCALNGQSSALAIEPSRQNAEIALTNVRLNRFNINIVECAAASSPGTIHGRSNGVDLMSVGGIGDISVACKSVDQICQEANFTPDIIKIDTEGYELEVLKGACAALSRKPAMIIEIHPQFLAARGQHQSDIYTLLRGAGYEINDVAGSPFDEPRFCQQNGLVFHAICR